MLYKFRSKVTADLIMLPPHAQHLLSLIGKDAQPPRGILLPEQMSQAVQALQEAVLRDDEARAQAQREARDSDEPVAEAQHQAVTLRQRAAPFLEMIRQAQAAAVPVVWGD